MFTAFVNCTFESDEFRASNIQSSGSEFHFSGALNCKKVDFSYSKFTAARFGSIEFNAGVISFDECEFSNTGFHHCNFRGELLTFHRAKFLGDRTEFGEVGFRTKRTHFDLARFEADKTWFGGVNFGGEVMDFSSAKFKSQKTEFIDTQFESEYTAFDSCELDNHVLFSRYPEDNSKRVFSGITSFESVDLVKNESLVFQHTDLSSVRFLNTDLASILFVDVTWARLSSFRIGLFDEQLLHFNTKTKAPAQPVHREFLNGWHDSEKQRVTIRENIQLIRRAYQQLRLNYEKANNHSQAGDFYYGEMEMTRLLLPLWRRIFFSWEALYWLTSGYGERWQKSLFSIAVVYFGFPVLFLASGLWSSLQRLPANYFQALQYNFLSMTFQKDISELFIPSMITKNLVIVESAIVPVLITLFVLALRRKFKR